jgi:cytochrome oxidase Cu insertion factor (SCO1/SenC/PrrC family)
MRWVIAAAIVGLAAVGGLGFALASRDAPASYRGSEPPAGIRLPEFALRDQNGQVVRSAELAGKVALVTFLDSQCTEACPVIAAHVAQALEALMPAERARVEAVAISTDPAEDTRESVRDFLGRQRALEHLRYLVGPESELRPLWRTFQILSSLETGEDTVHSAPVRIYQDGVWVATLHAGADLTPANLVHDIRVALG